ncbi:UDP-glucose:2-hydroxyflavanone C-glucosyltransferase [Citrus sinensis]|uniref:UDP-glucose:2-hydroxyflavanone C-glucosyltransferase n=1 Tax=Citrus sinensis TaxID=2711 RepID=A0ACB8K5E7_CITSI|nr:UDP-glucose:2-hydroxyflavanone C-glucosyltransferase [Citrus sinensis]
MADSSELKPSRLFALLSSSGMGHLTPFLRLAALLTAHHVKVTCRQSFILFHLRIFMPIQKMTLFTTTLKSPENHVTSSLSLLPSLSSPPLSAPVTDMTLTASVLPISRAINVPNYIFFTSSAKMLTLFVSFHTHTLVGSKDAIEMPTLEPIPKPWILPPLFQDMNNFLKTSFIENAKKMTESDGILVNISKTIEGKTLAELNGGKVIEGLPLVIPIGLLPLYGFEKSQPLAWLDDQATGSVVDVSFGSRTGMSREQLRELGDDKKVDREDDLELSDVIGHELMDSVKGKGLVVKHWLDQESILRQSSNRRIFDLLWVEFILAWPQHGDQKINADVVERTGMGIWVQSWGWGGEAIMKGEQIAENISEMMGNELLRIQEMRIREEARTAIEQGGSLKKRLTELVEMWKN